MPDSVDHGLQPVTDLEARAALARMVGSGVFRTAPQLAAFITYIVEATLSGRRSEIKGYTIAVEALGRSADFDPVSDPIVRVEAGRLRRAIEQYYAGEGAGDPVRIVVERGGYVPAFVRTSAAGAEAAGADARPMGAAASTVAADAVTSPASTANAATSVALPLRPRTSRFGSLATAALLLLLAVSVAVLTLRMIQPPRLPPEVTGSTTAPVLLPVIRVEALRSNDSRIDDLSRQFSGLLTEALARFDEFVVVDAQAAVARGRAVRPDYILEHGGQLAGATVVATVRLMEAATGRVLWSSGTEEPLTVASDARELRELVRRLTVRIAQPYGVLHASLRETSPPGSLMRCVVDAYDYWGTPSEPRHAQVRDCLQRIVQGNPGFHPAWSLLATVTLDEHRIGYNARPDPLARAMAAARRAVQLAPESARAQQSLMAVLTVGGDIDEALRVGFEAVRRNPYDTDILADLGARLTQAGRGTEGRPLLERAADLNQARPPWHDFYRLLAARQAGDRAAEQFIARSLAGSDAPLALLGLVVAHVGAGRDGEANRALKRLSEISPIFARNPAEFLDRSFFAAETRDDILRVIDAARKAGS